MFEHAGAVESIEKASAVIPWRYLFTGHLQLLMFYGRWMRRLYIGDAFCLVDIGELRLNITAAFGEEDGRIADLFFDVVGLFISR